MTSQTEVIPADLFNMHQLLNMHDMYLQNRQAYTNAYSDNPEAAGIKASKAYYNAHKEGIRIKQKTYYQEHRETLLAGQNKYYQDNREAVLAKLQEPANLEKKKTYRAKYNDDKREHINELARIRYHARKKERNIETLVNIEQ